MFTPYNCEAKQQYAITQQIESSKVIAEIMTMIPSTEDVVTPDYVLEIMSLAGLRFAPVTKYEEAMTAYDHYRTVERY